MSTATKQIEIDLSAVDDAVARFGVEQEMLIPILLQLQEHYHYLTKPALERVAELTESRRVLEDLLGTEVAGVAAPYGRYDAATVEAARAAGYQYMCTCRQHQTNLPRRNPFLVDRLEINRGDDSGRVERKLDGAYARVYRAWYRLNPATRHWVTD